MREETKKKIPNILTSSRIVSSFGLIGAILFTSWNPAGLGVWYGLTVLTDCLDGYLARKWKATSDLGAFLDGAADKVLNIGVLLAMLSKGMVPSWPLLMLARDIPVAIATIHHKLRTSKERMEYEGRTKLLTYRERLAKAKECGKLEGTKWEVLKKKLSFQKDTLKDRRDEINLGENVGPTKAGKAKMWILGFGIACDLIFSGLIGPTIAHAVANVFYGLTLVDCAVDAVWFTKVMQKCNREQKWKQEEKSEDENSDTIISPNVLKKVDTKVKKNHLAHDTSVANRRTFLSEEEIERLITPPEEPQLSDKRTGLARQKKFK